MYRRLYKTRVSDKPEEGPFKVDVVFSFDTTGSMSSVIESVRQNLKTTVDRLFHDVEGIRIGIIVHGDYCDFPKMMWVLEPTKDQELIKEFIMDSPNTSGGDYDECYELVLHAANHMQWKAEVRVLVVIGDARPHEVGYHHNSISSSLQINSRLTLDWRKEAEAAKQNKITVFSCHAMPDSNESAIDFYDEISRITGGYYFPLNRLQAFKDYMVAICLRAADSADTLELLEASRTELEAKLKALEDRKRHATTEEERTRLDAEEKDVSEKRHEFASALTEARSSTGLFTPALSTAAKKARGDRKTRLEEYEGEKMNELTSGFCDLSTYDKTEKYLFETIDILSDRTDRSTPYRSKPRESSSTPAVASIFTAETSVPPAVEASSTSSFGGRSEGLFSSAMWTIKEVSSKAKSFFSGGRHESKDATPEKKVSFFDALADDEKATVKKRPSFMTPLPRDMKRRVCPSEDDGDDEMTDDTSKGSFFGTPVGDL